MMNTQYTHQQQQPSKPSRAQPLSLRAFSELSGLSLDVLRKYCSQGRILGARKHHLTKQWWIYPPAKIVPSQKRW